MTKYDNLHPVQMEILTRLMFRDKGRFKDIKVPKVTSDNLSYHINTLIKLGLLTKSTDLEYGLTIQGKEFCNRIDEERAKIETQAKLSVLIVVTRTHKGKRQFLVCKRLKQPFFGMVGFHTGKVKIAETVYEAAHRELKEETGLTADLYFHSIFHFIDYNKSNEFLRDIFMYAFWGYNPKGTLIEKSKQDGVENYWATLDQLKKVKMYPDTWNEKYDKHQFFNIPKSPPLSKTFEMFEEIRHIDSF